ncbi:tRNA dimethylallyltransferase [Pilibacter termitis]|uniref:tRNA dimethylallyltransferase n=1 Tax=Pilibacter termitis TaxID=263852 RepID=A0A1T4N8J4_9ENTE|nr:tRNA (adenosine(37)-N6)-dimethylallyltransferase MiaA [Pilibacter termitis]SJZ75620.1 tRNA dimethylallyltransferase [Pilibacter termitis]
MSKAKIIAIVGPTAVGKTALGIELAQRFNGEIISGDSLQVYKRLDIGTAKATSEEQNQAIHHLIDVREINENYSASDFQHSAKALIEEITARKRLPIVVGGTGLYIQSLLEDYSLGGVHHFPHVREKYEKYLEENGKTALWELLYKKDVKSAEMTHENNTRRIIRALEVLENTGKSIVQADGTTDLDLYQSKIFGLTTKRELLYERINLRVKQMQENGLLEEARFLYENYPNAQAAAGIGYKEFFPYFKGEITLDMAIEKVQQHSRNYAKRQLTWFRNRMNTEWFDLVENGEEKEKLFQEVEQFLAL